MYADVVKLPIDYGHRPSFKIRSSRQGAPRLVKSKYSVEIVWD